MHNDYMYGNITMNPIKERVWYYISLAWEELKFKLWSQVSTEDITFFHHHEVKNHSLNLGGISLGLFVPFLWPMWFTLDSVLCAFERNVLLGRKFHTHTHTHPSFGIVLFNCILSLLVFRNVIFKFPTTIIFLFVPSVLSLFCVFQYSDTGWICIHNCFIFLFNWLFYH